MLRLGIVDHLRRRFACFKLGAHFLNLIGLLLEARGQGLNLLLLQSNPGFQFLHNALLFEQLVCRQRRLRGGNAKLAVCSYDNRDTGDFYTRNVADKATVAHVRTVDVRADTDDVISRGNPVSRANAQSRVGVAGGVAGERCNTVGRVVVAGGVEAERKSTCSRVGRAGGVENERINTVRRVGSAGGVAEKRLKTVARVGAAGGVAKERLKTVGRVFGASGVAEKRLKTVGRVFAAGGVAKERVNTVGRVFGACGVADKRLKT